MTTKRLVRISYFTMLTVIGSLIRLQIGPLPFTLQTLFVIMSGLILGAADGAFSQLAFMVLGLVGLPIFTGGGGISYVLQPSFGYIVSFSLAAFLSGLMMRRFKTLSVAKIFAAGLVGLIPIYTIGPAYQVIVFITVNGLSVPAAFATLAQTPIMLVKDIILILIVSIIYPRVLTMIGKSKEQKIGGEVGGTPLPEADTLNVETAATKDTARRSDGKA